ncbi:MAG: hypothetical protein HQM09_22690 [Candidatus Riflebacteria bacterium]|nr:hypothetical protein [Candidatus Riflebacteria bacterium]
MTAQPVSQKSRLEVIDTALQKKQERNALWYLLGLLAMTLIYEFGDPLIDTWANAGIVIPEVSVQEARPISPKKLDKLAVELATLGNEHPILRESLIADRERLAKLTASLAAKGATALLAQNELCKFLNGLWKRFHQPIWLDRSWFSGVNSSIDNLLKLLKVVPDDTIEPPVLDFGPRRLSVATFTPPGRDLFEYGGTISPEK